MAVTITEAEEMLIRTKLADQMNAISYVDRVVPSPIYFSDSADYWRSIDLVSRPTTQKDLETRHICALWIIFRGFEDLEGPSHSPLTDLTYEFYYFSQYDLLRENENATPAEMAKRVMKYHNDFIAGILEIKGIYQGEINLGVLDTARFARQLTTPVVQEELITDRGPCEYIRNVEGHIVRLFESVRLKLKEC